MRVTFLGTGTSHGVPMIGCGCPTCRSTDPRDQRWRPSIYLELPGGARVLVDASPDLRAQALRFDIKHVDVLLLTHSHADHVLGFDELRRFNAIQGTPIPCYGDLRSVGDLRRMFAYAFDPTTPIGGGIPEVRTFVLMGPFSIGGATFVPIPILHGNRPIFGYRVGRFAYLTDCSGIPDASWPLLEGVDVLVLGALRDRPHPAHFNVDQAVEAARRASATRTFFTHMCHDLPHAGTCARLPDGMTLAFDGLTLDVSAAAPAHRPEQGP